MTAVLKVKLWLAGAPGGWWPEPGEIDLDGSSMRPLSRNSSTEFSWTTSSEASSRSDDEDRGLNTTIPSHSPALRERMHESSPLGTIRVHYVSSDDDDNHAALNMAGLSIQESRHRQPAGEDSNSTRSSADDVTTSEEEEGAHRKTLAASRNRRGGACASTEPAHSAPTIQRRSRAERAARNASWSRPVLEQTPALTPTSDRRHHLSCAPKFWTPVFFESYPSAETMARIQISFAQAAAEYQEEECSETERQVLQVVRRNRIRRQTRERVRRLRLRQDREALAVFRNQARAARRLVNEVDHVIERLAAVAQAEPAQRRRRRGAHPGHQHGYPIAVHAPAPPAVDEQRAIIVGEMDNNPGAVDPREYMQVGGNVQLRENRASEQAAFAGPSSSAGFAATHRAPASERASFTGPPSSAGFAAASQAPASEQAAFAGPSSSAGFAATHRAPASERASFTGPSSSAGFAATHRAPASEQAAFTGPPSSASFTAASQAPALEQAAFTGPPSSTSLAAASQASTSEQAANTGPPSSTSLAAASQASTSEQAANTGPPSSTSLAVANRAPASEQAAFTGPPSTASFTAASQAPALEQAAFTGPPSSTSLAAASRASTSEQAANTGPPSSTSLAVASRASTSEQAAITGPSSSAGFAATCLSPSLQQAARVGPLSPTASAAAGHTQADTPEEAEPTDVVYDPANFAMWTRPSSSIAAIPSLADSSTWSSEGGMYLVNPQQLLREAEEDVDLFELLGQPAPNHGAPAAHRAYDGDQQDRPDTAAARHEHYDAEFMSEFLQAADPSLPSLRMRIRRRPSVSSSGIGSDDSNEKTTSNDSNSE
ncbi:hypothetical protein QAD02_017510 [Eretmocerus hayati]|uniref:Uncharacterized protein n=1 Tax=Eretmocerus hayati TaxID=131215 RepID=A0ACC2PF77_9HYME|nr:hypothetical protein QAD02_017510 [Eretmocerus hayati]